jgi:ApaG protein
MSTASSHGVRVDVGSVYVPERSNAEMSHYFFAYQVTISNDGDRVVQLKTRHWIITDSDGAEEHIRGPGVIGETPVLKPGQTFTYTSACPLKTPVGSMHGSYQMTWTDTGEDFDAEIAPFGLAVPGALN